MWPENAVYKHNIKSHRVVGNVTLCSEGQCRPLDPFAHMWRDAPCGSVERFSVFHFNENKGLAFSADKVNLANGGLVPPCDDRIALYS